MKDSYTSTTYLYNNNTPTNHNRGIECIQKMVYYVDATLRQIGLLCEDDKYLSHTASCLSTVCVSINTNYKL